MHLEAEPTTIRQTALVTAIQRARDALTQAFAMSVQSFEPTGSTAVERQALAKALLKARRRREDIIRGVDFADPAWDMLLDLYVAHAEDRQPGVVDVCLASAVPMTTALRWVAKLEATGHVERAEHLRDRRRYTLRISDVAFEAVDRWLGEMAMVLK